MAQASQHLYRRFFRVISMDIEPTSTNQIKANLEVLPFRDGCVDLIVCLHVMEHVKDDLAAMRQMRRVLTPGGVTHIHVPLSYMEGPVTTRQELGLLSFTGPARSIESTIEMACSRGWARRGWLSEK